LSFAKYSSSLRLGFSSVGIGKTVGLKYRALGSAQTLT
jgi:hypothetical protein